MSDKAEGQDGGAVSIDDVSEGLLGCLARAKDELSVYSAAYKRLLRRCRSSYGKIRRLEEERDELSQTLARLSLESERWRDKTESVLRSIMPESVAQSLVSNPRQTIASDFDSVSIVACAVTNFEAMVDGMGAKRVIGFLNQLFSVFDLMLEERGIEKIRSSGERYLCVAGCPVPRPDHGFQAAELALDLMSLVKRLKLEERFPLTLRVGIHSGPAVAGVVGERKYIWDVIGPTVDMARSLEAAGVDDAIQVSSAFMHSQEDAFEFESSGLFGRPIPGDDAVWILKGRKDPQ